jgi:hypothetical protein
MPKLLLFLKTTKTTPKIFWKSFTSPTKTLLLWKSTNYEREH